MYKYHPPPDHDIEMMTVLRVKTKHIIKHPHLIQPPGPRFIKQKKASKKGTLDAVCVISTVWCATQQRGPYFIVQSSYWPLNPPICGLKHIQLDKRLVTKASDPLFLQRVMPWALNFCRWCLVQSVAEGRHLGSRLRIPRVRLYTPVPRRKVRHI